MIPEDILALFENVTTWRPMHTSKLNVSKIWNEVNCDKSLFYFLAPDPQFGFEKKLDKKKHGKTKRKLKLKCKTDDPNVKVKWYKDGKEIKNSDPKFLIKSENGEQTLEIKEAEKEDSGKYTCKIEEFGKEGENETSCDVSIGGLFKVFSVWNDKITLFS